MPAIDLSPEDGDSVHSFEGTLAFAESCLEGSRVVESDFSLANIPTEPPAIVSSPPSLHAAASIHTVADDYQTNLVCGAERTGGYLGFYSPEEDQLGTFGVSRVVEAADVQLDVVQIREVISKVQYSSVTPDPFNESDLSFKSAEEDFSQADDTRTEEFVDFEDSEVPRSPMQLSGSEPFVQDQLEVHSDSEYPDAIIEAQFTQPSEVQPSGQVEASPELQQHIEDGIPLNGSTDEFEAEKLQPVEDVLRTQMHDLTVHEHTKAQLLEALLSVTCETNESLVEFERDKLDQQIIDPSILDESMAGSSERVGSFVEPKETETCKQFMVPASTSRLETEIGGMDAGFEDPMLSSDSAKETNGLLEASISEKSEAVTTIESLKAECHSVEGLDREDISAFEDHVPDDMQINYENCECVDRLQVGSSESALNFEDLNALKDAETYLQGDQISPLISAGDHRINTLALERITEFIESEICGASELMRLEAVRCKITLRGSEFAVMYLEKDSKEPNLTFVDEFIFATEFSGRAALGIHGDPQVPSIQPEVTAASDTSLIDKSIKLAGQGETDLWQMSESISETLVCEEFHESLEESPPSPISQRQNAGSYEDATSSLQEVRANDELSIATAQAPETSLAQGSVTVSGFDESKPYEIKPKTDSEGQLNKVDMGPVEVEVEPKTSTAEKTEEDKMHLEEKRVENVELDPEPIIGDFEGRTDTRKLSTSISETLPCGGCLEMIEENADSTQLPGENVPIAGLQKVGWSETVTISPGLMEVEDEISPSTEPAKGQSLAGESETCGVFGESQVAFVKAGNIAWKGDLNKAEKSCEIAEEDPIPEEIFETTDSRSKDDMTLEEIISESYQTVEESGISPNPADGDDQSQADLRKHAFSISKSPGFEKYREDVEELPDVLHILQETAPISELQAVGSCENATAFVNEVNVHDEISPKTEPATEQSLSGAFEAAVDFEEMLEFSISKEKEWEEEGDFNKAEMSLIEVKEGSITTEFIDEKSMADLKIEEEPFSESEAEAAINEQVTNKKNKNDAQVEQPPQEQGFPVENNDCPVKEDVKDEEEPKDISTSEYISEETANPQFQKGVNSYVVSEQQLPDEEEKSAVLPKDGIQETAESLAAVGFISESILAENLVNDVLEQPLAMRRKGPFGEEQFAYVKLELKTDQISTLGAEIITSEDRAVAEVSNAVTEVSNGKLDYFLLSLSMLKPWLARNGMGSKI